ncbi:hypothetical protein J2T57_000279 [Natronocella acetinitrilica]|uniref:YfaZ n=1 Tax=Natronocella acetinitrilica TaxID=414046 RepID=A0AAE3G0M8_9GAMM|nr:YfaZ family outer membrane protein [Natronocella acetinitrilica]MCP1673187.1 hypothetical protein [Natronocella acetinitrilica]
MLPCPAPIQRRLTQGTYRRLAAATLAAALLAAPAAQSVELEIALSDEMFEGLVSSQTARSGDQGVQVGGGALYNDERDLLGTLFLQVNNRAEGRWQPFTFGVGTRLWGASLERPDESVFALALGGSIGIGIPAQIPMAVTFQGHASPNITTSGDADRMTEGMVRFEAEIIRGAHAFVGYRQIKVKSREYRDVRIDDGFHAGIRLRF